MQLDLEVEKLVLNKLAHFGRNLDLATEFDLELKCIYKLLSVWSSTQDSEYANSKIQTTLTAAQLAYFVKLLIATDLIIAKSLKELFQFLSDHVQTKGSLNVSENSLYLRYFENDDSSKTFVQNLLIKMISNIGPCLTSIDCCCKR